MNLLERFPKFTPSEDHLKFLKGEVLKLRIDKEQRMMEVDVASSIIIPKIKLYQIESEIKKIYNLSYFRINPKYHAERCLAAFSLWR